MADLEPRGVLGASVRADRATPWAAAVVATAAGDVWDALEFDDERCTRLRAEDLCQVCGRPRGEQVYLLAAENRAHETVQMYGGALCSLACARLTAVECPHYYTKKAPIEVFVVPRQVRVDLFGGGFGNDDEHNLAGLQPIDRVRLVQAEKP
ncbi:hypothetical protein ACIRSS_23915 [Amycolatopsis sp. NPDC101161]|uniref:hypothetical protein n=1 Tax=Amycolatopsis sp. NPDC101161 TaxID=3363940 RepID=UPI0037FEFBDD